MNDPAVIPAVLAGAATGGLAVAYVSWQLWWLLGRPPALAQRVHERRQLAHVRRGTEVPGPREQPEVEHAGRYVQQVRAEGGRAGWSQLDPPGSFARVRDARLANARRR